MKKNSLLRLGTRGSKLAVAQSTLVAKEIEQSTGVKVILSIIETKGDKIIDKPLAEIGGKGLFTLELEEALRNGDIDFAVHSCKDLPTEDAEGLSIVCIPKREDHRDAVVGGPLRKHLIVGTGSARRVDQLVGLENVQCKGIRGNIDTRIKKMEVGDYDRVVLAMAGLNRLAVKREDIFPLSIDECVPAPAQGALSIQASFVCPDVIELVRSIHDEETATAIHAERHFMSSLGGGCHASLGAFMERSSGLWRLSVFYKDSITYVQSSSGHDPHLLAEQMVLNVRECIRKSSLQ
jgi:hydroxymethylbilane synthase